MIDTPHLKAAVAIWEYSERSVDFIFKDAIGRGIADSILNALRENDGGMTETDINSQLFSRNVPAAELQKALALLAETKAVVNPPATISTATLAWIGRSRTLRWVRVCRPRGGIKKAPIA